MATHIAGLIEIGQIWQHWKGGEYEIVLVDRAVFDAKEGDAVFVESKKLIPISTCDIKAGDEVIVYSKDPAELWARSRDNFTEILGDTHDPVGGTMFYRFTRLK